jgi:hypothetical protein
MAAPICRSRGHRLLAILETLREIVEAQPQAAFDRAHFKSYGASSPEYGVCMGIQQAIKVALFERFEQERISFAYPTQTVYFANAGKAADQEA